MKPTGYLHRMEGMLQPRVRMHFVAKASAVWIQGMSPSFKERKILVCDSSKVLVARRLLHHLFVLLLLHFLRRNGVSGSCALLLVLEHAAKTSRVCHEPFLRSLFIKSNQHFRPENLSAPTISDANCATYNQSPD